MERYSFEGMATRAEAKLRQKRPGDGPYLIVVGTEEARAFHILRDMTNPLRMTLDRWMGLHPEASAFHFVAPRTMTEDERVQEIGEELSLQVTRFFGVTVRNQRAVDPLPQDFEKNWAIAP
mgnify:CR=1 FL=1